MFSHAWAFSTMILLLLEWIDSHTCAFSRMNLFTYESTSSRMDWLSQLWILRHEPLHLWICLLTYGLTLSPMLLDTWASSMNLPSHVCSNSVTCAFSRMSLFTYESTFSRMDWLSLLCFLTHEPFHLWVYLLTYKVTFSPMFSHAWVFSPMNLLSHVWIHSLSYAFSRMRVLTYESTFSRMDSLFHLCFLTHELFHLWAYLLTYGLTLSPMLSHAWAFSRMHLLSHVWIDSLT